MRLVLDTNVFIVGFLDLAENSVSPEVLILEELNKKIHTLIFSDKLEEQILRVALRVKDKDFVGLVRHLIWSDFLIEYFAVNKEKYLNLFPEIPRKDLDIFLTAHLGSADYMLTNDSVFLEKSKIYKTGFISIGPSDFVNKFSKH